MENLIFCAILVNGNTVLMMGLLEYIYSKLTANIVSSKFERFFTA